MNPFNSSTWEDCHMSKASLSFLVSVLKQTQIKIQHIQIHTQYKTYMNTHANTPHTITQLLIHAHLNIYKTHKLKHTQIQAHANTGTYKLKHTQTQAHKHRHTQRHTE